MASDVTLKVEIDVGFQVAAIFASEDTLSAFVHGLTKHEAGALYELIHSTGVRWSGRALDDWRRTKR